MGRGGSKCRFPALCAATAPSGRRRSRRVEALQAIAAPGFNASLDFPFLVEKTQEPDRRDRQHEHHRPGEEVDEGAVLAFFLLQSGFLVFGRAPIAHPLRLATPAPGPSASVALAKIALASSPAVA